MHCDPSSTAGGQPKAKSTTGKHTSLAIKELCKQYNRTPEEARCIVNTKRRVVYVLSTGHISSQDCFVNDTLKVDKIELPEQRKKRKCMKRKHNEILHDAESTSLSPKKQTDKRTPKKKHQVLTVIPDGFRVAFCAFKHAWMGEVSYQSTFTNVDGYRTKMIGMYKVTPVDALGCAEHTYESDYCPTPTGAFRQAYGKKFGEVDCGRPNGRLFFGFHFIDMQLKLHSAFEHQFLGAEVSETSIPRKERALFDRWCGELSFRTGILPWTLHTPIVRNASLEAPASLESVLATVKTEAVVVEVESVAKRRCVLRPSVPEPTTCADMTPRFLAPTMEKSTYVAYSDVFMADSYKWPPQQQQQQQIAAELDAVRSMFVNEGEECALEFETLNNFDSFDFDVENMPNAENTFDLCGEQWADQFVFPLSVY